MLKEICYLEKQEFITFDQIKINLEKTLFVGQIFHFIKINDNLYCGTIKDYLVVLKQLENNKVAFLYSPNNYHLKISKTELYKLLFTFFNLHIEIFKSSNSNSIIIYNSKNSQEFKIENNNCIDVFSKINIAVRFITNDFYSSIFSFICSQNNNIKRITEMVKIIYSLGNYFIYSGVKIYKFPALEKLQNEEFFRRNKFGYRARYISEAATMLLNNKNVTFDSLLKFKGIGRKVRDCIALTSMELFNVVPVDTHIFQWSKRYLKINSTKLNLKTYKDIQMQWKEMFGDYGGIIQFYVFNNLINAKENF